MQNALLVQMGQALQGLTCHKDSVLFRDASLTQDGKDGTTHEVHGHPNIFFAERHFTQLD
jgi:hypothetical protein